MHRKRGVQWISDSILTLSIVFTLQMLVSWFKHLLLVCVLLNAMLFLGPEPIGFRPLIYSTFNLVFSFPDTFTCLLMQFCFSFTHSSNDIQFWGGVKLLLSYFVFFFFCWFIINANSFPSMIVLVFSFFSRWVQFYKVFFFLV